MVYIGIDIGGTKTALGIFDEAHTCIAKHKLPTDLSLSAEQFAGSLIAFLLEQLHALSLSKETIGGIGIGCPSNVNSETGVIYDTTNIPKLRNFCFAEPFQRFFQVPVVVDNDANAAALAEHRYGAGRGFSSFLYATASTGLGGGLILNNRLFRGADGFAGEIGHAIITYKQGLPCNCGNVGCFESYAGGANIGRHVHARIARGEETVMTTLSPGKIDGQTLAAAFAMGDAMAISLLDQIGAYIGIMLFNIYKILNLNCYVIGGGLTNIGEPLFSRIRNTFDCFARKIDTPIFIKPAELTGDFGIIGAMELLFCDPQ